MNAWMRRCSVVGLLAAMGCGGPVTGPAEDVPQAESALTVTPTTSATNATRAAQAPTTRNTPSFTPGQAHQLGQAVPNELLEFEAFNIPNVNDGQAHLVVGMMSCGFWELGKSQAEVWGGKVRTKLSLYPTANGAQGFSVYFYVDRDHDGTCSTGDDVYEAPLPALPASGPVVVDASTLAPTYAGCWLFQL